MWVFCLRSFIREYGWRFAAQVALRHPLRTWQAFDRARRLDTSGSAVRVSASAGAADRGEAVTGPPSIVGVGFCLKPIDPPCPSGRANHDCRLLEDAAGPSAAAPAPCRPCTIRACGTSALQAGSAFYVMTSARDILDDVFVPAMAGRAFTTGLFALCRYSFQPFALGLLASGMRGELLALGGGDCRDYGTWLLADRGIKDEQTSVDGRLLGRVTSLPKHAAPSRGFRVERRGNVFWPVPGAPDTCSVAGTPPARPG